MKHFALITGCILLALISGATASSAFVSKPRLGLEKTAADTTTYTESDLHKLILNNLGLLSDQTLTDSNQQIINNHGEPVLAQKILLNYLLLVDTDNELSAFQTLTDKKSSINFHPSANNNLGIINYLFDRERQDSVVSEFEKARDKLAHVANHLYTSIPAISKLFNQFSFSFDTDAYGNVVIVENRSGRNFPVNKNVSKCVNDLTKPEIRFDVPNGAIYTNDGTGEQLISVKSEDLQTFAENMCFLISMPKFITKDTTPALFTFILQGLRTLENAVDAHGKATLMKVVELAYGQFKKVLAVRLGEQHVAGQIVKTNGIEHFEAEAQKILAERPVRILTETEQAAAADNNNDNNDNAPLNSAQVVFRVFGIAFVLVLAVILASLASIQVDKDTLVYSKFLTVDQRK